MKALVMDDYGIEKTRVAEIAAPDPGPGEVRVRVRAAALNRLDLWTASGDLPLEHTFPHVLGADASGEVDSLGDGVKGLKPGARVIINPGISCGACEFCRAGEQSLCTRFGLLGEHLPGAFGEFAVVPEENVFPIPAHLSFEEGAALGVTYVTAYRMLFNRGRFAPGEWLLITGIGGGLALSLFELARPVAGRLFVTSSSQEKIERAIEMGADGGVNYKEADVGKEIRRLTSKRGVDLAADSASGAGLSGVIAALRKGGRLVVAGATAGPKSEIDMRRVFWNQLEIIGCTMGSVTDFSDMLRMVAGTRLRPRIDRKFLLDDGVEALRYLDSGDQFGKVIIEVP